MRKACVTYNTTFFLPVETLFRILSLFVLSKHNAVGLLKVILWQAQAEIEILCMNI